MPVFICLGISFFLSFFLLFDLGIISRRRSKKAQPCESEAFLRFVPSGIPFGGGFFCVIVFFFGILTAVISGSLTGVELAASGKIVGADRERLRFFSGLLSILCFFCMDFFSELLQWKTGENGIVPFRHRQLSDVLITGVFACTVLRTEGAYFFIPFFGNVSLGIAAMLIGFFILTVFRRAERLYVGRQRAYCIGSLPGILSAVFVCVIRGSLGGVCICSVMTAVLIAALLCEKISAFRFDPVCTGFFGAGLSVVSVMCDAPWLMLFWQGSQFYIYFSHKLRMLTGKHRKLSNSDTDAFVSWVSENGVYINIILSFSVLIPVYFGRQQ